jgi:hypothetical protein
MIGRGERVQTFVTRRRLVLIASAASLIAVAVGAESCGNDDSTFADGPCESTYQGLCGRPCSTDDGCPSGLYCGDGQCRADCVSGDKTCTAEATCDSRGRCFAGGQQGFGDSGQIGFDGGGGGDACIDLNVDLSKIEPTVVLLVDESSSMGEGFGAGGGSRWSVVEDVLMNVDGGIVKRLEGEVTFGLSLFTRAGGWPQDASSCPRLLSVAPASGDFAAMAKLFADNDPTGGTPTGESIDRLIGRVNGVIVDGGFATQSTAGPKIIVLATDGEPDICANGDDEDAGRKLALAATQAAYAVGIRTYVIGVGSDVGAVRLQELANAGAGQPIDNGDASPFSTTNRDEFVAAMNAITFNVRSCTFALNGTVQSGEENAGTVLLDGKPLPYGGPDGWKLDSPSQLEVVGSACTAIKNGSENLTVRFPCGTFEVDTH